MEGVWRDSDVDRATIWYCSTYKSEAATPKCSFLTTCLPWFFAQIRKSPFKFPSGHSCGVALPRSYPSEKTKNAD
jgi:hypothetical protein